MTLSETAAARAFGLLARDYDISFEGSYPVRYLRRAVYGMVRSLLPGGARILDINCGTGTDCIALAQAGYRAFGTDISAEMIAAAREKARSSGSPAEFSLRSYHDLDALGEKKFDLLLSNFGGMNCSSDLRDIFEQAARRLAPGGYFLPVIMPPFSIWEYLAGRLKRNRQYVERRRSGRGRVAGVEIPVYFYSEHDVRRAAEGLFTILRVRGFNMFSPPPNAGNFQRRFPRLTVALHLIDRCIARLPAARGGADHIAYLLKKKETGPGIQGPAGG